MAGDTLRIGFVGAGAINRTRHVPGLKKVRGVEFEVVANRSQASSQAAADEYGIKRTAGNWMEVVEDQNVDVVWIGTHPSMHREITIAALEAGKHVFTQARMAMDYADAKLMWEAAQKYPHLTTNICAPPHYMRGDRVIRRMLAEGYVGQPLNVVVQSFSDGYADPKAPRHWRQEGEVSGYNTLDVGMMIEVMQPLARVREAGHGDGEDRLPDPPGPRRQRRRPGRAARHALGRGRAGERRPGDPAVQRRRPPREGRQPLRDLRLRGHDPLSPGLGHDSCREGWRRRI